MKMDGNGLKCEDCMHHCRRIDDSGKDVRLYSIFQRRKKSFNATNNNEVYFYELILCGDLFLAGNISCSQDEILLEWARGRTELSSRQGISKHSFKNRWIVDWLDRHSFDSTCEFKYRLNKESSRCFLSLSTHYDAY